MQEQASIEEQLVDPKALSQYLEGAGLEGPFEIRRHIAGHSCETFFIDRGGDHWVMRRPPLAVYLPTAHDVMREFRVLEALKDTSVRAPRPLLACTDESVIGAPFYVMERVEGSVIRTETPAALDNPEDRGRIGSELVAALAELHEVDYEKVGLEGFGKPSGYLERQVRRWTGQLELATSITSQSREVPEMWQVRDWLAQNLPESSKTVIVHGDYKLDNVMFAPDSPATLAAIFDWEMSTLGDPLSDLGWMLSYWREAKDPDDPLRKNIASVTTAEGFHTRRELVEQYSDLTQQPMPDLTWYVVAAIWKLACLLEGSYGRHLMGTTDDPFFADLSWGVPALAKAALDVSNGSMDL